MDRQYHIFIFFIGILAISLSAPIIAGPASIDIYPGVNFFSTTAGGPINFTTSITTTGITWVSDIVRMANFIDVGTWADIGFQCPTGATMEITQVTTNDVRFETDPGAGSKTWRVYAGARGTPTSVTGGTSWSYGGGVVSIVNNIVETVILSWGTLPHVTPLIDVGLMDTWLGSGDISGFVIAIYTSVFGQLFFAFILLMISIPLYTRTGAIPTAIIWVLFWGVVEVAQPAIVLDVGIILLGLSIGFLIFSVYMGRRGLG